MNLGEYAAEKLPEHGLLGYMLVCDRGMRNLEVESLDARRLRKRIARYANGPHGAYGRKRIALYGEVADLFEALCIDGYLAEGYDLNRSFLGSEEIDLAILRESQEAKTHQQLADEVLHCSTTTVDNHISNLKDGARIGDMCVSAQFDYGGTFESSVHPVRLPLNLSEVYVLLDAIDEYTEQRDFDDPHHILAARLGGMIKAELTDYAKERLASRLGEGLDRLHEEDPVYIADACGPSRWVMLEKSQTEVSVCLADGSTLVGRIGGSGWIRDEEDGGRRRGLCVVGRTGRETVVPWSEVVDIERA